MTQRQLSRSWSGRHGSQARRRRIDSVGVEKAGPFEFIGFYLALLIAAVAIEYGAYKAIVWIWLAVWR